MSPEVAFIAGVLVAGMVFVWWGLQAERRRLVEMEESLGRLRRLREIEEERVGER